MTFQSNTALYYFRDRILIIMCYFMDEMDERRPKKRRMISNVYSFSKLTDLDLAWLKSSVHFLADTSGILFFITLNC